MKKNPLSTIPRVNIFSLLMITFVLIMMSNWIQYTKTIETIPYSQFITYVNEGRISEVDLGSERIIGTLKNPPVGHPKEFTTLRVNDSNLVNRLTASNIRFSAIPESKVFSGLLAWVFPIILFLFFWSFILKRSGGGSRGGGFLSLGKSKAKIYVETDLKTRFEDIAGVDEAKGELFEIVNFLKDPASYSRLGGRMPKGILLIGPPGTGKTLLSRAVAGEARVPFFSINGSEFVELFVGLGAARVRDLFEQARGKAPCIIFIDELDALGKARGMSAITGSSNDEKEQTLNQLLAEMDGFDPAQGIILLAATNRPEVLDPALLRAGRFDRQILVDKPDRIGREQILEIHMKKIKLAPHVDVKVLASMTAGFSGADLANLVNEAALIATRNGDKVVSLNSFTFAIERIIAGLERRSRVLNHEEKKRVAYHEMGHAIVALALGQGEVVHKVSIIPRGLGALGYTMRRPTEDRYLMSSRELESKMAIALAGRASEDLFFDDISTGSGDDLDKATDIARAMVTRYGMDPKLGLAVYERESSAMLGNPAAIRAFEFSEKTAQQIDNSIQNIMNRSMKLATDVIHNYKALIEEAVHILIVKETIDEIGLKQLWEKYNGNVVNLREASQAL